MPGHARKARWFWPVLATLLLADCTTKELVVSALASNPSPHRLIGDLLRISLSYNPDAAMNLSFGGASRVVFGAIATLAAGVLFRPQRRTPLPILDLQPRRHGCDHRGDSVGCGVVAGGWSARMNVLGVTLLGMTLEIILSTPPLIAQSEPGRLSRAGVARAQAVVDSVFLDRKASEGTIDGGDWASYLMARLRVEPIPDQTEIKIVVDTEHIVLSGRIQDLPPEARAMIGPLAALVDSGTVLSADIVQVPAGKRLIHFWLRGVSIGGLAVPEVVIRAMLLDVGKRYPALTETGRDLYVEIPADGRVTLIAGAVRLTVAAPGGRNRRFEAWWGPSRGAVERSQTSWKARLHALGKAVGP